MIRRPNNQIYKTVVIVWISLSVASVVLAALNWVQLHRNLKASAQAAAIQEAADAVLKSLLDAETAVRGFAISGMDEHDARHMLTKGFAEYLAKPIDLDVLQASVARHLGADRARSIG